MSKLNKLVISSILMSLGIVLALVVHATLGILGGQMFLPLHFPIMFIGFLCGMRYGIICGILLPLLNFVLFGRPPFPSNVAMALELLTYGGIVGLFRNKINPIFTLLIAIFAGRVVNLFSTLTICGINNSPFAITSFLSMNFVTGLSGIVIQLILIPSVIYALYKAELIEEGTIKWSLRHQEK